MEKVKTVKDHFFVDMFRFLITGRLIFNMGIAIPGKTVFLIETAPRFLITIRHLKLAKHENSQPEKMGVQVFVFFMTHIVDKNCPNCTDPTPTKPYPFR